MAEGGGSSGSRGSGKSAKRRGSGQSEKRKTQKIADAKAKAAALVGTAALQVQGAATLTVNAVVADVTGQRGTSLFHSLVRPKLVLCCGPRHRQSLRIKESRRWTR